MRSLGLFMIGSQSCWHWRVKARIGIRGARIGVVTRAPRPSYDELRRWGTVAA
jgi:hypothetical protein